MSRMSPRLRLILIEAAQTLAPGLTLLTLRDVSERVARAHRAERLGYRAALLTLGLAALGLYAFMTRALRPVGAVVAIVQRVADGDLSVPVQVDSGDEIGQIKTGLARMVGQLHGMMSEVQEVGEAVAGSAGGLSGIAAQASAGAGRQREETAQVAGALRDRWPRPAK